MRRVAREGLTVLSVLWLSSAVLVAAGLYHMNDTGVSVDELRVTFSEPVVITGFYGELPLLRQAGGGVEWSLFGGQVEPWQGAGLYWEPVAAVVVRAEWFRDGVKYPIEPTLAWTPGLGLPYEDEFLGSDGAVHYWTPTGTYTVAESAAVRGDEVFLITTEYEQVRGASLHIGGGVGQSRRSLATLMPGEAFVADASLSVWDPASDPWVPMVDGPSPPRCILSPGGSTAYVTWDSPFIPLGYIMDVETGARITLEDDSASEFLSYSADGKKLALRRPSDTISVWDCATWSLQCVLPGIESPFQVVHDRREAVFDPSGQFLAVGAPVDGPGDALYYWCLFDLASGSVLAEITCTGGLALALSPGAVRYVTPFDKQRGKEAYRIYDRASGALLSELMLSELENGGELDADSLAVSPDGRFLLAMGRRYYRGSDVESGYHAAISVWSLETLLPVFEGRSRDGQIRGWRGPVKFSTDWRYVTCVHVDGDVSVWELPASVWQTAE